METFNLKVILPNAKDRIIPNCTLYKGKVVKIVKKGVGEKKHAFDGVDDVYEYYDKYTTVYHPIINSDLLAENGLTPDQAKNIIEKNQDKAIEDERIFNCLFVLGENKGNKICINKDAEEIQLIAERTIEQEKKILLKEIPIPFVPGIFGLKINIQLPKSVWALVSKSAQYHKGDMGDMEWAEDMGHYDIPASLLKGWYYNEQAIDILANAGYPLIYRGQAIKSSKDISKIDQEIKKQEKEEYQRQQLRKEEMQSIHSILNKIRNKGIYITKEEADTVSKLKSLEYISLGIKGPDIYGGGEWLYNTDDVFYYVRNNGMDGDDWSLNNFPTGGAGAICIKVIKPDADVEEFLKRANSFK